ncbi:zinc finger, CCHC-type containing protein [Tanacetum coccineum]
MEWYHNLRIVLSTEDKIPFLEQPIPGMPVPPAGQVTPPDVLAIHSAWVKAQKEIAGLMLMTMDPDIQKNLEQLGAFEMLKELKMFYIDNLERLDHVMTQNLSVSLILVLLRKEYDRFVQNYNIHSMGKTVTELHDMLKLHEKSLPPKEVAPALHAIRAGRIRKNQKKKSHKAAKGNQGKGKDVICHQCGEVGHWRRNCPIYLAELIKKKKLSQGASTSGCGTHICITTQGLSGSRKLKPGALSLYVGDGHRATVEAIGEFHFNKRAKLNLNSALLWHFRLEHISKKRIEKLQHDGLLDSTDIKSFEKCVSLFQKEVENQLGKTTKSLRSDRGGEYMSQEFLDHLKEHGIIAYRTPPYTPQHNGVSERRNRTLLDMVHFMMSQTTLLKSFWDYALESVARILNMVPTKKVDKTPYEHTQRKKMGYSFYYPPENKVFVARNVEFLENSLISQEASGSLEGLEIIQEEDTHPSLDTSLNHECHTPKLGLDGIRVRGRDVITIRSQSNKERPLNMDV